MFCKTIPVTNFHGDVLEHAEGSLPEVKAFDMKWRRPSKIASADKSEILTVLYEKIPEDFYETLPDNLYEGFDIPQIAGIEVNGLPLTLSEEIPASREVLNQLTEGEFSEGLPEIEAGFLDDMTSGNTFEVADFSDDMLISDFTNFYDAELSEISKVSTKLPTDIPSKLSKLPMSKLPMSKLELPSPKFATAKLPKLPNGKLSTADLPTAKLPTAKLSTANLPTTKLSTIKFPTADFSKFELPTKLQSHFPAGKLPSDLKLPKLSGLSFGAAAPEDPEADPEAAPERRLQPSLDNLQIGSGIAGNLLQGLPGNLQIGSGNLQLGNLDIGSALPNLRNRSPQGMGIRLPLRPRVYGPMDISPLRSLGLSDLFPVKTLKKYKPYGDPSFFKNSIKYAAAKGKQVIYTQGEVIDQLVDPKLQKKITKEVKSVIDDVL